MIGQFLFLVSLFELRYKTVKFNFTDGTSLSTLITPVHISTGTAQTQRISIWGVESNTFDVTFGIIGSGRTKQYQYRRITKDGSDNTGTISPEDLSKILLIAYFPSNFANPSLTDKYGINVGSGVTTQLTAIEIDGTEYALTRTGTSEESSSHLGTINYVTTRQIANSSIIVTRFRFNKKIRLRFLTTPPSYLTATGEALVWENTNPPDITQFSVGAGSTDSFQITGLLAIGGQTVDFSRFDSVLSTQGSIIPEQPNDNSRQILEVRFLISQGIPNTYSITLNSSITKTLSAIEVNGNEYTLGNRRTGNAGTNNPAWVNYTSQVISRIADRWSSTNTTNTFRFKFSDGTYLTASSSTIDLDTRPTGTISFTLAVTGRTGQDTTAQIVRLPDGANIGTTFSGVNGANISTTLPNITQPTQTTTYRLIAHNTGGSNHRDATVTVTQNPALSNCSARGRSGGQAAPQGVTVDITCTVKGYPRPVITVNQGWVASTTPDRHFTTVSGQVNTWTWEDSQFYGTSGARTFIVTATNSSGSTTASVPFNQ